MSDWIDRAKSLAKDPDFRWWPGVQWGEYARGICSMRRGRITEEEPEPPHAGCYPCLDDPATAGVLLRLLDAVVDKPVVEWKNTEDGWIVLCRRPKADWMKAGKWRALGEGGLTRGEAVASALLEIWKERP